MPYPSEQDITAGSQVGSIRAARTEAEFWEGFDALSFDVRRWPNGLAALWTPTHPLVALRGDGAEQFLEGLSEEDDALMLSQDLSLQTLGDIRRDVRAGRYVVSVRRTDQSWVVAHDARDTGVQFSEPMLPAFDLGLIAQIGATAPRMRVGASA